MRKLRVVYLQCQQHAETKPERRESTKAVRNFNNDTTEQTEEIIKIRNEIAIMQCNKTKIVFFFIYSPNTASCYQHLTLMNLIH